MTSNDFTDPVTFKVIAEDGISIQDWVITVEEVAVGIDKTLIPEIQVYPNPFSEKTTIVFSNPEYSVYKLAIYNMSGAKLVEKGNITSNQIELDRGNLSSGMYIVELKGKKIFRERLIVE